MGFTKDYLEKSKEEQLDIIREIIRPAGKLALYPSKNFRAKVDALQNDI